MKIKSTVKNNLLPIIILQVISAAVLLLVIIFLKYLSKNTFNDLKKLYADNFESDTNVNEVIEPVSCSLGGTSLMTLSKTEMPIYVNSFYTPVKGPVTSKFGYRSDPFTSKIKKHYGTDIAADTGSYILSADSGTVSFVGFDKEGYGNYITVKHSDNLKTLYAHCSEILVNKDQKVTKGQIIARVGNSGKTTGSHLHFEVRVDNVPIDPEHFMTFCEK